MKRKEIPHTHHCARESPLQRTPNPNSPRLQQEKHASPLSTCPTSVAFVLYLRLRSASMCAGRHPKCTPPRSCDVQYCEVRGMPSMSYLTTPLHGCPLSLERGRTFVVEDRGTHEREI